MRLKLAALRRGKNARLSRSSDCALVWVSVKAACVRTLLGAARAGSLIAAHACAMFLRAHAQMHSCQQMSPPVSLRMR